jgi:hypothetical protein
MTPRGLGPVRGPRRMWRFHLRSIVAALDRWEAEVCHLMSELPVVQKVLFKSHAGPKDVLQSAPLYAPVIRGCNAYAGVSGRKQFFDKELLAGRVTPSYGAVRPVKLIGFGIVVKGLTRLDTRLGAFTACRMGELHDRRAPSVKGAIKLSGSAIPPPYEFSVARPHALRGQPFVGLDRDP